MPEIDGLAATRLWPGPDVADPIAVVVVTTFDLDEYVRTAIANGASGFLLKDAGAALLVEAVRAGGRRRRARVAVDHGPVPRPLRRSKGRARATARSPR